MGFIRETYSNNQAGLVVSFAQQETSETFFAGDSVEAAMKHFKLYLDDENRMRIDSESDRAMETLGIEATEANTFRSAVDSLLTTLDDETADANKILFPLWSGDNITYAVGDRVRYNGILYKVLQAHTSQSDWTPTMAASLFARCIEVAIDESGNLTSEVPEWVQPDSTNAYSIGDTVMYNGVVYESLIDNNIWSPEAYPQGWKQVEE